MNVFDKLFSTYEYKNNTGLVNMTSGFFALFIKRLFKEEKRSILVVSSSLFEARKLYNACNSNDAILFENDDANYGKDTYISPELKVDRINILDDLRKDNRKIVFTDVSGYLKFLPSGDEFDSNKISVKCGDSFSFNKLISSLSGIGYERVSMVSKMGEFAQRGFVLDIFPVNCDNPVRLEFFGDEVVSIRFFDINSQRSIERLNDIVILPCDESLSKDVVNICEYLDNPIVIFKDYEQVKFSYEKMVSDCFYFSNEKMFFDLDEINAKDRLFYFDLDNEVTFLLDSVINFSSGLVPLFNENFDDINKFVNKSISLGKTVVIALDVANFSYFLERLNFPYILTSFNDIMEGKVNIVREKFSFGFEVNNYVFLSGYELFNKKSFVSKKTRFKNASRIKDLSKLSIGDYVVHNNHGIGIYNGIRVLTKFGVSSDYLEILYAKGDKLYVPASKIELINKYTGKDGYVPKVNALSSSSWEKVKRRVREKIRYESERLIKVQAEREMKRGYAFSPDQPLQVMFENDFIYEETPDQLAVISEIKKDMENSKPMDRILCGDVGYGKTEVAFRAMFKAVLDNKQVLYLCPTTLLCKQQYEVALERFKNFPVNIAILNRFVSPSDVKKTLSDLKDGKIDILFGTHRILSNDVVCNDLGLLVIDEEQRFGVAHKEKIKEMKANVDVLTLTATPIPRTLQMAVLGIRNLSLIETPPKNRKSVLTYVTGYDEKLIRDVIYKEVSRGGQVFILHNRVEDIELKTERFRSIAPDVSFGIAHGQMDKSQFESIMNDFTSGKFDVLVCTTIIETGVDIPNVNTLIVLDADRFGLSQLYQIRGRVGRSDALAYAYLMYDKRKVLTETAVKRLKVIKDFTELGSGFAIASRDLSIRGAGDILGSEQAGFIDTVGIDLYLKMLNEEIARLKGLEVEEEKEDINKINVSSHIKDSYVKDEDMKILIHKLINSISDRESLMSVKIEIEDRFGKIDEDLDIYMHEQLFENFVNNLGIIKVFDNSIYREVVFDKEFSSKLNYEDVFVKSLEINKNFKFSFKNNMLSVSLYYKDCDEHIVYDFIKFFEEL